MFPRCAPNMTSRQKSANGSNAARWPIAADARFMSNGSCPQNARTNVSRKCRVRDGPSKPDSKIALTQANAPRVAPVRQRQAPKPQKTARGRARFEKPSRSAGKSPPGHKNPRLLVLPMSMLGGRHVWRNHSGNSRTKADGARREAQKAARHGTRAKGKSAMVVLARQYTLKSPGAADLRAAQNQLAVADPQKGALAANRDAPCALSAAG